MTIVVTSAISSRNLAFWRRIARSTTTPPGDPTPARADIEMSRQVVDTATPLGIAVHDHIIIGRDGHVSLKGLKLM
jgi:DNA repair protein RadC